jgi:hypothetical protein
LIVKRHQIDPLHGTAPLDAVTVNRFDHDSSAIRSQLQRMADG